MTDADLTDAVENRSAAEGVVRWIHRTYENEHTNQDYRTCLRTVGRFADGGDEVPDALAWIPTGTSNDFDPVPSERDLVTEDEMRALIGACRNPRDAGLIAVQSEAGLRGGELYNLEVGDVFDAEHTTGLHVDGKEGERSVHLRISLPHLQRWLDAHPAREDDDAPLWSKLSSAERPSYTTFLNYFRIAAGRADVSKDVTPTNLRKPNTRWLVLQEFETPRIEDRQGRKRGSDHTQRYLAAFGSESNEVAYLSALGEDIGEDAPDQAGLPVDCPRCGRETPRDRALFSKGGQCPAVRRGLSGCASTSSRLWTNPCSGLGWQTISLTPSYTPRDSLVAEKSIRQRWPRYPPRSRTNCWRTSTNTSVTTKSSSTRATRFAPRSGRRSTCLTRSTSDTAVWTKRNSPLALQSAYEGRSMYLMGSLRPISLNAFSRNAQASQVPQAGSSSR